MQFPQEVFDIILHYLPDHHLFGCVSRQFRIAYLSYLNLRTSSPALYPNILSKPRNFLALYHNLHAKTIEEIPYTREHSDLRNLRKNSYTQFIVQAFCAAVSEDLVQKSKFTHGLIYIITAKESQLKLRWWGDRKTRIEEDFEWMMHKIPISVKFTWLRLSESALNIDTPLGNSKSVYAMLVDLLHLNKDQHQILTSASEDDIKFFFRQKLFLPSYSLKFVRHPFDRWAEYLSRKDWADELDILLSNRGPSPECKEIQCLEVALKHGSYRCLDLLTTKYRTNLNAGPASSFLSIVSKSIFNSRIKDVKYLLDNSFITEQGVFQSAVKNANTVETLNSIFALLRDENVRFPEIRSTRTIRLEYAERFIPMSKKEKKLAREVYDSLAKRGAFFYALVTFDKKNRLHSVSFWKGMVRYESRFRKSYIRKYRIRSWKKIIAFK
ncbi:hypothetical protein HK098_005643 [Nowakowskiella sp. JEL0407]|nr:hypothetical protein HK098_005643 [Nowakowskiella sp. JEL0407]